MSESILSIKDLCVSYDMPRVLDGINLEIKRGEVLCIVGESGSGKSTLIKAICGNQVHIDSGEILYEDRSMSKDRRYRNSLLGSKIGLIQQNPEGAFNPIRPLMGQFKETAKSNGREFDKNRLSEIFEILGLDDTEKILKSRPYELSGGMNQRIAIAASFMLEPKLLLCDEITSALDVSTAISVTDELMRLKNEMGVTVVLVTHNLGIAANIADRIAIMHDGKIVECNDSNEIMSNPRNAYTKRLINDVPKLVTEGAV